MTIFGGCSGSPGNCGSFLSNAVWTLINANGLGGTPQWVQLTPSGTLPPARTLQSATYDPASNRMMVFGGAGLNATWVLTNANGLGGIPQWIQLSPTGSLPPARTSHTAVYHSETNRMTIFSGFSSTELNDVWTLSNANGLNGTPTWTQILASGSPPLPREASASVYDPGSNRMIVFGGSLRPNRLNDVWVLLNADGIAPSQLGLVQSLPNRGGNAGQVTVRIIGSGFQGGATVRLTGLGADIVGTNTIFANASVLTTTFNLIGVATGVRNVVVTNPDNTSITLPAGFTVEQGGAPQVTVDIVGRNKIRFGTTQTYYAVIQNHGTVDAANVASFVSQSSDIQSSALAMLNAPFQAIKSSFLGTLGAGSSKFISFTATGPAIGSPVLCPSVNGKIHIVQPNDSCAARKLEKLLSDAYLNFLYALRLGNLATELVLINTRFCFNPTVPSSSTNCDWLESLDSQLDAEIKAAEAAATALCLQAPPGCLICNDPKELNALQVIGDDVKKIIDDLKQLFALSQIPLDRFQADQAQLALFLTQALALPSSLVFTPQPEPQPSPTDLPADNSSSLQVCGVGSLDPNSKTGATGVGPAQYIQGSLAIPYFVSFENISTATAPAQTVTITDTLNTNLDLSTLTPGPITFPKQVVTPPSIPLSLGPFTTTVDLRPANNLLVKITANLNVSTSVLKWTFQSLDPITGLPPTDPLAGFLPPGGEGSVFFTVLPKSTVTTGTVIQNTASIVFDVNPPILTPTWSNTIDNTKPTSRVLPLAATQNTSSFTVQWSGTDVGSGIQDFTIYVSDNGGPFTPWLTNTTATQANYTGLGGHTYRFYSIARDSVGNVENTKTIAEATTTINLASPTIRCSGCYFVVNGLRATLAFNIGSPGSSSTFSYNYRDATRTVQFSSTSTTQISVSGNTATFSGQGTLNGQVGYSFAVTAKDGGVAGSGLDTVSIAITGPSSYSYSVNGTVVGGDIVVKQ